MLPRSAGQLTLYLRRRLHRTANLLQPLWRRPPTILRMDELIRSRKAFEARRG